MSKEFKPIQASQSKVMERPGTATGGGKGRIPTIPGSGQGFRPDRQPSPRKSHKLAKGLGLVGVAAVGGTGVYLGTQGEGESSTTNTVVGTTVDVTQPPLTSPETTVITVPPTTETPTTTAERVFASPEQEEQVLGVEANMVEFFALTTTDIAKYKETTHFDPNPDGFSTVNLDLTASGATILGINLGVFQIKAGDGLGFISVTGVVTEDGARYAFLSTVNITDSVYTSLFPAYDQTVNTETTRALMSDGIQTYIATGYVEIAHSSSGRTAMVEELNSTVGKPVTITNLSDPSEYISPNYPIQPNPKMAEIVPKINQASTRLRLASTLEDYSTETLHGVGVYKEISPISQFTLNGYDTANELISSLPSNAGYRLFDQIPTII